MIHCKQQVLLYSVLITLFSGQTFEASSALVSVAEAGSVTATLNMVAREAAQMALGVNAGSPSEVSGSESLKVNTSVDDIMENFAEAFTESEASAASHVNGLSSTGEDASVSKQVELQEATDALCQSWTNNRAIIKYVSSAVSNHEISEALSSLPIVNQVAASEQLSLEQYGDALYNIGTRQQIAYLKNNFSRYDILPEPAVEILSPVEIGDISIVTPPVTYDVTFSPKQELYLLMSYAAESTKANSKIPETIIENIARLNYTIDPKGQSKYESEQQANLSIIRTSIVKIRENYGKIQQAIAASLKAQADAEVKPKDSSKAQADAEAKAEDSSIKLWKQFKIQFNLVQDKGIFTWLKYKFSVKKNQKLGDLFKGSDFVLLRQYVEGALGVLAYEMVRYSSIVKMGANIATMGADIGKVRADEKILKFVKEFNDKNTQNMFNYIIFGGFVIGGAGASMSEDEAGIKARVKASYVAMKLKMANESSVELLKTFGQLAWYSVTGKVLTLDPKKYAAMINAGKLAQVEAMDIIDNPDQFRKELEPVVERVQNAMTNITPSQAYGLNFQQPLAAFIAQIKALDIKSENVDLDLIASTMAKDPTAALALRGALFDVMSTASLFAKAGWWSTPVFNAFRRVGEAMAVLAHNDSDSRDVDEVKAILEKEADVVVDNLRENYQTTTNPIAGEVGRGDLTIQEALGVVVDSNAQVNALLEATATELRKEAAQAVQSNEAQTAVSVFTSELFAETQKMQDAAFKDLSASLENISSIMTIEQEQILRRAIERERGKAALELFKASVRGNNELFVEKLERLNLSLTDGDVINILRSNLKAFSGLSIGSSERKYLQGYLQGMKMSLSLVQKKKSVEDRKVISMINLMKLIARA